MMEASVRRTAKHATGTRFDHVGETLADLPTIRNYIGSIRVATDGVRALLEDTLRAAESQREDSTFRVLECKAAAGESAIQVLDTAMRVCAESPSGRRPGSSGTSVIPERQASWARQPTSCMTSSEKPPVVSI